MHQLIASYLFQYKECPLPGLGTLTVTAGKAETDFLNTAVNAPLPTILFDTKENEASSLLDYIAAKTNDDALHVVEKLSQFCNTLKSAVIVGNTATLKGVGDFFSDASGKIKFKANSLPAAFLQPVKAERVIHPESEHHMLVGDKETTNKHMNEYFSETPVKKDRWWIWAIVLGAIALIALLLYLNQENISSMFGNAIPL